MEEPVGAQYAVQVALHTLKERCKNLQHRVTNLEEENLQLKGQLSRHERNSISLSDFDQMKAQLTELSENKLQLMNKIKMVTNENQELWNKLSRLTHVNHNLGTQLSKINDSLVQYTAKNKEHAPLIRSKTFTQDEPQTRVLQKNIEENGMFCAELEEISLKIISGFAQEKSELESLYSEIRDLQWGDHANSDSCGIYCDDYDNNIIESFNLVSEELRVAKQAVVEQKIALGLALEKLQRLQEAQKKICDNSISKSEMLDKSTSTIEAKPKNDVLEENKHTTESTDKICPICCKNFSSSIDFDVFEEHVEKHFTHESFEMLSSS